MKTTAANQNDRRDFIKTLGTGAFGLSAASALVTRSAYAAPATGSQKIKVGQIGTKHAHASGKMGTMRKYKDLFDVVGVVEPDDARRKSMEKHSAYKGLKWMTEQELLNTKGLAAVAVETEIKDLVPTASRCIDAGVHIHLDKPGGTSLSAYKNLLTSATAKKRVVQMGYMLRYNPAFQIMFKLARNGDLGELFELHTVMSKTVGAGSRKSIAKFAGGSMFELGCHIIDSAVYLLGKPDKVTAYLRKTKPEQDDLADNCLAVLEYPKATATIRSALVEVEGFKRRQFVVLGDQGTVDIRPMEPPKMLLALSKAIKPYARGYQEVKLAKSPGRYDYEFIDLAKIIRGQKKPDFLPAHDLATHETILRASGMALDE
jgi:predicted dehydrogenase